MKENCTHTRTAWVNHPYEDWTNGEMIDDYVQETVYTVRDIDLHRYQCYNCNKIMYYSGAAREYYEEGKITPGIRGLDR